MIFFYYRENYHPFRRYYSLSLIFQVPVDTPVVGLRRFTAPWRLWVALLVTRVAGRWQWRWVKRSAACRRWWTRSRRRSTRTRWCSPSTSGSCTRTWRPDWAATWRAGWATPWPPTWRATRPRWPVGGEGGVISSRLLVLVSLSDHR